MKILCIVYTSINGLAPSCLTEMSSGLPDKCKRGVCNTKADLEISCVNLATVKNASLTNVQQCGIICVRI